MEADEAFKYKQKNSWGSIFCQLIFSHIGLFFIIIGYACLGALIFIRLEENAENLRYEHKRSKGQDVNDAVSYAAELLWYYGGIEGENWTYLEYKELVYKDLRRLESHVLEAVEESNYDGTIDDWSFEWRFMNAALLCITILTTIGYGTTTPVTFEGQMFCIVYALIGCPVFLIYLANLGDAMAKGFTYIYSRCCCRSCRSTRYVSELPDNVTKRHARHIIDDRVGEEDYMPTSKVFVPITINLVVLHLYFFFGAFIFSYWESWTVTSSFYFTFVTLSTVGYGDFVPGNSLTDNPESLTTTLKLCVSLLYIVLGMALVSMCINLMQEQIVQKCRWVSRKIGLSKNNEVSEPKPIDKRKDSLMPLIEGSKGSSPFRDQEGIPVGNRKGMSGASSPMPGIIWETE